MSTDLAPIREDAYAAWKQLQIALGIRNKSYAVVGASLKRIRDEDLWKHMGDNGYKSWSGFLSDPQIGMSVKTAYNYIFFYTELVERLGYTLEDTERISYTRLLPYQSTLKELPVDIAKGKVEQINSLTLPDFERHQRREDRVDKGKRWYWLNPQNKKLIIKLESEDVDTLYLDGDIVWKTQQPQN